MLGPHLLIPCTGGPYRFPSPIRSPGTQVPIQPVIMHCNKRGPHSSVLQAEAMCFAFARTRRHRAPRSMALTLSVCLSIAHSFQKDTVLLKYFLSA